MSPDTNEKKLIKEIELKERYVFNQSDDKYITYLAAVAKPIVIDGETHRAMQRAYCADDGRETEEICVANDFPHYLFSEYKTIHGWTRKSCILTPEEVLENTVEESVQTIINHKKFEIYQEVQKRSWRETEKEAEKWSEFKTGVLDPFEKALTGWSPPKLKKISSPKPAESGEWFVIGFSDWQIGAEAVGRYLFRQEHWNTEIAGKAVEKFCGAILADIEKFRFNFEGCVLMLAGDLFHGLKGETEKGTSLQCDLLRDDQCDALLTLLSSVITRLAEIFPQVKIHSVRGNHDGTDHYPVMLALKNYFRTCETVEFNLHSARTAMFKVNDTLIMLDHGASDMFKNDVPKSGKPRESYIQSIMLSRPGELVGVNQTLFFQGDKHHYEQIEYADFEFIMMGALPLGDQYSDNLNLASRARQNCFVIDRDGLKCSLHYYIR